MTTKRASACLLVAAVLALTGCRDLVAPGERPAPPPARPIEGTVTFGDGRPVVGAIVQIADRAYVDGPDDAYSAAVYTDADGRFVAEVDERRQGWFDLTVDPSDQNGRLGPFTYLGLPYQPGQPHEIVYETVPVQGWVSLPEDWIGVAPTDFSVVLFRRETRPHDSGFTFTQEVYPEIGADGRVEGLVPPGPWEVELNAHDLPGADDVNIEIARDFLEGELDLAVDFVRLEVETVWPAALAERAVPASLLLETTDDTDVVTAVAVGATSFELWAPRDYVSVYLDWEAAFLTQYALRLPLREGGGWDATEDTAVQLLFPPRVVLVRVREGGGQAATDADIRVHGLRWTSSQTDVDVEGEALVLCEDGDYRLEVLAAGASTEVAFTVAGENLAVEVDLDDSVARVRRGLD